MLAESEEKTVLSTCVAQRLSGVRFYDLRAGWEGWIELIVKDPNCIVRHSLQVNT